MSGLALLIFGFLRDGIFSSPKAYIGGKARNFSKSHRLYIGESSESSCTSPSFLHTFSTYFQRLGPKGRGEGVEFQEGGRANFIFTPGVEIGIFLGRWPMIGRNFPHLSSRFALRHSRFRVIFFHIISSYLLHIPSDFLHISSAFGR